MSVAHGSPVLDLTAEKDIADGPDALELDIYPETAGDHESLTSPSGRLLYPNSENPTPRSSRTPSALDLSAITNGATANPAARASSSPTKEPQPWDLVDPPRDNNNRKTPQEPKFVILNRNRKIPKSSYYFGPPPSTSAYGSPPMGTIGIHHPREIVRIERDYTGGEGIIQFAPIYPLELEGRITPTQFLSSINSINEILISAHSIKGAFIENALEVFTLGLSKLVFGGWYDKEMRHLQDLFQTLNQEVYNPAGLNLLWPRSVGFLFMEIEYY
ncbi:Golgin subfamily A member 7/ERF4 family-domain-containing protein [Mycena floridula]|nr:Golgin subfamily A member 7/ERF4 family-domain-containing protein [Mycena floridula]